MRHIILPGRTSLFTAAALTALATASLFTPPTVRAAMPMQHMTTSDTGFLAEATCAKRHLTGRVTPPVDRGHSRRRP